MSYTDQSGNSGNTSTAVTFGGTNVREATRAVFLPLASGDTGIRSIETVTVLASTGTAGNFGITIGEAIAYLSIGGAGLPGWRDYVTGLPGLPKIESDACLALLWIPQTTTVPELFGGYSIVEA
jgi:hypothetical protein